jgi:hypothetical protein
VGAELMLLFVGALLMAAVDTVMERYHIECFMVVLLWFLERERINVDVSGISCAEVAVKSLS